MKIPTVKALGAVTRSMDDARLVRRVLETLRDSARDESAWRALRDSDPRFASIDSAAIYRATRAGHTSFVHDLALTFCDRVLDTCGVESCSDDPGYLNSRITIAYCNRGDSYATTLMIVVRPDRWRGDAVSVRIGSIGDTIEASERRGARFA